MAPYFKQFKFAKDEVIVNIPIKIKPELQAVEKAIEDDPMPPTNFFKPIRVVANIAFEEVGKPGIYLKKLGGVVKIKVKYTQLDKATAGTKLLILAYWDGKTWVLLNKAKHKFVISAYKKITNGGYGVIWTDEWDDPPMAWGT